MPDSAFLVAVPADIRTIGNHRWHAAPETYLNAVLKVAGGLPVIVPALADAVDVDTLLSRVDGVLVTGSVTNVHPSLYGVAPSESHEPYDTDRDAMTLSVIRGAIAARLPLLAICRGLQELNVACGGSLATEIQDLDGRMDHRAPLHPEQAERYAIRQPVTATPGGMLAGVLGREEIQVNSLHRQAIDRLGDGLVVEATAPDGTIEAVRVADAGAFALGVQWHPEYWAESDEASAAIFRAFGDACRAHRAAR
ncbi:glutamine amidotransferase [Aureimonas sp. Leaf454]|uniref:gamma-glutamyl-gamma-aminobutyrate hydrolase family protein n=1 Tax=Aureimonas sp. Leaf454 TaxID=1736381 RepID=UPI0006FA9D90|nr:gamma-glutamyl-gamma-aminobutyrate hydrolase family protein [Aureimonas sp. Leaf454]KQT45251.1 glutamine amidotransferase [Aureimonas sp. Leaf454]